MILSKIFDTKTLKQAFHVPYSVKEGTATGDEWHLRVIRRIRQIGLLKPGARFWSAVENLVWGLAPGSSLLIVALTLLCVRMYLNLGHDYFSTVTAHLGKVTLAPLIGYEG
jgi:hypothetical protein